MSVETFEVESRGTGKPDYSKEVSIGIILPFGIEDMNTMIQASRYADYISMTTWRYVFLCPAGLITTIPLLLPTGYVCTRRYGHFWSDYYSEDISLIVSVDGHDVTNGGLPLTTAVELDFGDGFVKTHDVTIKVDNTGTTHDINLTFQMTCSLMTTAMYEGFWRTICDRTIELLLKGGVWTP